MFSADVERHRDAPIVQRDLIDCSPHWTYGVNRLGFFALVGARAMPWDEAEITHSRATAPDLLGRAMTIARRLTILLTVPLLALLGLGIFTRLQLNVIEAASRRVAESRVVALATLG